MWKGSAIGTLVTRLIKITAVMSTCAAMQVALVAPGEFSAWHDMTPIAIEHRVSAKVQSIADGNAIPGSMKRKAVLLAPSGPQAWQLSESDLHRSFAIFNRAAVPPPAIAGYLPGPTQRR